MSVAVVWYTSMLETVVLYIYILVTAAVQNERDRISTRRQSYDETGGNSGMTLTTILNAEQLSRQVSLIMIIFVCLLSSHV